MYISVNFIKTFLVCLYNALPISFTISGESVKGARDNKIKGSVILDKVANGNKEACCVTKTVSLKFLPNLLVLKKLFLYCSTPVVLSCNVSKFSIIFLFQ